MPNRLRNSYNLSIPRQFSRMTFVPKGWQMETKGRERFVTSVRKRRQSKKKVRTGKGRKGDIDTNQRKHQEEEAIKKKKKELARHKALD